MTTTLTFQETLEADLAQSNRKLVEAAAPKAMTRADDLRAQAAALEKSADDELDAKVAAVRRIETLLDQQSRLRGEIESLENLAGISANHKANCRAALDCYVAMNSNPYAPANWVSATDQIMRAASCAAEIPGLLHEKTDELLAAQSEVDGICKAHSFDLKKVVAAIKQPRQPGAQIVYTV